MSEFIHGFQSIWVALMSPITATKLGQIVAIAALVAALDLLWCVAEGISEGLHRNGR